MKKALKAKWVAALRSGKYKQGEEYLKLTGSAGNTFCCLGVLCDISPAVAKREHRDNKSLGEDAFRYAGFTSEQEDILANMNDGSSGYNKHTFRGIATWIEKNL